MMLTDATPTCRKTGLRDLTNALRKALPWCCTIAGGATAGVIGTAPLSRSMSQSIKLCCICTTLFVSTCSKCIDIDFD